MLHEFSPFGILVLVFVCAVTVGAIIDSVLRHRERMAKMRIDAETARRFHEQG